MGSLPDLSVCKYSIISIMQVRLAKSLNFILILRYASPGHGKEVLKEIKKTAIENGCILIELASDKRN
jgi:hypothetical protein